jgi:hypothetical protein
MRRSSGMRRQNIAAVPGAVKECHRARLVLPLWLPGKGHRLHTKKTVRSAPDDDACGALGF